MKHIYIIEDVVAILEGLTFLLEKSYKVTAIADARIALKKLQLESPDLILLDFLMPDCNGAEFMEAYSRRRLNIPVLVMSACATPAMRLNYPAIAGFIRKPFNIHDVVRKIEHAMQ